MLNGLIEAGKKDSITYNEKQFEISKPIIQQQLKALIARDLFDMEAYFKIINQISDSYRKALEIIGNNEEYDKLLKGK